MCQSQKEPALMESQGGRSFLFWEGYVRLHEACRLNEIEKVVYRLCN